MKWSNTWCYFLNLIDLSEIKLLIKVILKITEQGSKMLKYDPSFPTKIFHTKGRFLSAIPANLFILTFSNFFNVLDFRRILQKFQVIY